MKDIANLEAGEYELEFVRDEAFGVGGSSKSASAEAQAAEHASVLKNVATGDEVLDRSGTTKSSAPATRFVATVERGKPVQFRTLGLRDQSPVAGVEMPLAGSIEPRSAGTGEDPKGSIGR